MLYFTGCILIFLLTNIFFLVSALLIAHIILNNSFIHKIYFHNCICERDTLDIVICFCIAFCCFTRIEFFIEDFFVHMNGPGFGRGVLPYGLSGSNFVPPTGGNPPPNFNGNPFIVSQSYASSEDERAYTREDLFTSSVHRANGDNQDRPTIKPMHNRGRPFTA